MVNLHTNNQISNLVRGIILCVSNSPRVTVMPNFPLEIEVSK